MSNCHPASTPVDTSPKLASAAGSPVADPSSYRSLAGALQYLTFTRPDIAYAVQQIRLHMHDPRDQHLTLIKRVLRYIKGTLHHGLQLTTSTTDRLVAYTDADWAGCPDTRRSTSVDTIRPSDVHLYSHLDPMETSGTKGAHAAAGGGMQWCYAVRSCR
ncbi:hypothetical protein QYE76_031597 [Lolium multiflorum]|uniref:Mitochondrial protein n=1 Tax=Lolium multiflorum TaxID=4521 RepID=A0AAD8VIL5_LOLMU|nr:hypothetical protein QYE76_031597 [Lolium multiflorum]